MPNWCYTQVCFKGKPDNINRLATDIEIATEFTRENGSFWCNVRYFLSLSNFDTVSYSERFAPNYYHPPTFRGYVYDNPNIKQCDDGDLCYYPYFEMAWNTDYELLELISLIYGVKYSAWSAEPGMGIYHKYRNDETINDNNYDTVIKPDYEQLEDAYEKNPNLDIDYEIPLMIKDAQNIIQNLRCNGITQYDFETVKEQVPEPVYGVYYKYIYGVAYDDEHAKFRDYPELDRFNNF